MVSHSEEVNRFAYVPKDWMDELSSQHRSKGSLFAAADPADWAICNRWLLMENLEKQALERAGRLSSKPLGIIDIACKCNAGSLGG
jgi:hypothetical protein